MILKNSILSQLPKPMYPVSLITGKSTSTDKYIAMCSRQVDRMAALVLLLTSLPFLLATDTALLTGGGPVARDGCELLSSSCRLPSLPWSAATNRSGRMDHVTLATEDGLVLACGGEAADGTDDLSCVSLDLKAGPAAEQAWTPHSTLDVSRDKATAIVLPGHGAFILGGFKEVTSSFLPLGGTAWEVGPVLPAARDSSYYGICSVLLTDTEFLLIGGHAEGLFGGAQVAQYDAARGDFISWPHLYTDRCEWDGMWLSVWMVVSFTSCAGGGTAAPGWGTRWWWPAG